MFAMQISALRRYSTVCLLGGLAAVSSVSAQDTPFDDTHTANLVTWTQQTVAGLPGSGSFAYVLPTATERANFKTAVEALLQDDLWGAKEAADLVAYDLVEFTDSGNDNEILYVLVPESGNTTHRGFYFVRPQENIERQLVLEAPHPIHDTSSATLAADAFRQTGARAFFFAGTHRCANRDSDLIAPNNSQYSPCSGQTTVCHPSGASESFVISDMGHNVQSFFQAFHEVLSDENPDNFFVQVHGIGSTYEYSLSDGRDNNLADANYLSNALDTALEAYLQPASLPGNSCNKVGDANYNCGTTNQQGRYSNATGSTANLCTNAAGTTNSGRFLHAELGWDFRHTGGLLEPQDFIDVLLAFVPTI